MALAGQYQVAETGPGPDPVLGATTHSLHP